MVLLPALLLASLALPAGALSSLDNVSLSSLLEGRPACSEALAAQGEDLALRLQGGRGLSRGQAVWGAAEPPPVPGKPVWRPVISQPQWVVPSAGLPPEIKNQASNNNVGIALHDGRLFMAFRTAPTHFASSKTVLYVMSSGDGGKTWEIEQKVEPGHDVREPTLLSFNGKLILYYAELGSNPLKFEPKGVFAAVRTGPGRWSAPREIMERGEMPWEIKVRGGRAWMTSYIGDHYKASSDKGVELRLQVSDDGLNWRPAGEKAGVYTGGDSEAGFEFDADGRLWMVTRNEDGDRTGFGSHVVVADPPDYSRWNFPDKSNPERYDSPRMFAHEGELYLVARRDPGGPFDKGWDWLPFAARKLAYLEAYWNRSKRTTLYHLNRRSRTLEPLADLPSAGDTAFPSIVQTGPHAFLVANYTSPVKHKDWAWLRGQTSKEGTQIYLATIEFKPNQPEAVVVR